MADGDEANRYNANADPGFPESFGTGATQQRKQSQRPPRGVTGISKVRFTSRPIGLTGY
jgi:hypothetical protein